MDSFTFLLLTNILLTLATAHDTKTVRFCVKPQHQTSFLSCTKAGTIIGILNVTVAYAFDVHTCNDTGCPFHQAPANNTFTNYVLSTCSAKPNCSLNISYLRNESFYQCGPGHGTRNTAEIDYMCSLSARTGLTTTEPASLTSSLMSFPRINTTEVQAVDLRRDIEQQRKILDDLQNCVTIFIPVLGSLVLIMLSAMIIMAVWMKRIQVNEQNKCSQSTANGSGLSSSIDAEHSGHLDTSSMRQDQLYAEDDISRLNMNSREQGRATAATTNVQYETLNMSSETRIYWALNGSLYAAH